MVANIKTEPHPDDVISSSEGGNAVNATRLTMRAPYDYGGNPLALAHAGNATRLAAFGGELQPGLYRSTSKRRFGNPAPLGLSAFALTTFVLSLINVNARGVSLPNIVVALAFGYGGIVQVCAGMW